MLLYKTTVDSEQISRYFPKQTFPTCRLPLTVSVGGGHLQTPPGCVSVGAHLQTSLDCVSGGGGTCRLPLTVSVWEPTCRLPLIVSVWEPTCRLSSKQQLLSDILKLYIKHLVWTRFPPHPSKGESGRAGGGSYRCVLLRVMPLYLL